MNPFTSAGPVFSHVGIYVRDIAKMEDFYRRVMGFIVTDRGSLDTPRGRVGLVFLSRDPNEHHQLVLATGRPEHLDFNLVNQMSFKVPGLTYLRAMYPQLKAEKDVAEILPATHGNAISIYFRDPEGNRIECFFDTPALVLRAADARRRRHGAKRGTDHGAVGSHRAGRAALPAARAVGGGNDPPYGSRHSCLRFSMSRSSATGLPEPDWPTCWARPASRSRYSSGRRQFIRCRAPSISTAKSCGYSSRWALKRRSKRSRAPA